MLYEANWKGKILKATLPVVVLGLTLAPPAFAESQVNSHTPPGMDKPSPDKSILVSVSPSLLATDVKPDRNVVFQLNTNTEETTQWMDDYLQKDHNVQAYVFDGTTATPLPASSIQFDASADTVTVSHPMLSRHKQYAVVMNAEAPWFMQGKNKYTDIVTGVNLATGTVTLLGHGSVSLVDPHGQVDQDDLRKLQVGDIVEFHTSHDNKHISLDNRHETALVALFTTGSAVGEATHVSANLANARVSVVDSGTLQVSATDDYGDPATNATVTVSGSGSGNSRVPSAFSSSAATGVALTNGQASVSLSDHSAETVGVAYSVQDGTYHDAVDTQTGTLQETFVPGPTASIQTNIPSTVTVGTTNPVSGTALDTYGNAVADGTGIGVTATHGSITDVTTTAAGQFGFQYKAPTLKGTDAVTLTAADSNYSVASTVTDQAGHPASISPASQAVTAGGSATLTFQVFDKYQNLVEDGESIALVLGDGTTAQPLKTSGGSVSTPLTATTKAGTYNGTLTAASNGTAMPFSYIINPDVAKTITLTPNATSVSAGTPVTVSGSAVDQYGNTVVDGTVVSLNASNGSVPQTVTTTGGQFTFTLQNDTNSGTDTIQASTASGAVTSTSVTVTPGPVANMAVSAQHASVVAGSPDTFTVTVQDQYGNSVADGTAVTLSATSGQVPSSISTRSGQIQFTLTNDTVAGNVQVTAKTGSVSNSASITIQPGSPAKATMQVPTLTAGTPATLSGLVTDEYGNVVPNIVISLTGASANATTDANGNYSATFTPTPELTSIGLTASGQTILIKDSQGNWVNALPVSVASIPVTVTNTTSTTTVTAGSSVNVTFHLTVNGHPDAGENVTLSSTNGSLSQTTVKSDSNGNVAVIANPSSPGTMTVTMTLANGQTATQQITIVSPTTTPVVGSFVRFDSPGWSFYGGRNNTFYDNAPRVNVNPGGYATYRVTVPQGHSYVLQLIMPQLYYLNNAPMQIWINGQLSGTQSLYQSGIGGQNATGHSILLWQSAAFSPGTYTIQLNPTGYSDGINVYGIWIQDTTIG